MEEIISIAVGNGSTGRSIIPSKQLASDKGVKSLDVILPILHGTAGEDGSVQGLLEMADIPYVGCNVRSSAVCMDKDMTKKLLKLEGIKVADWVLFRHNEKNDADYGTVRGKLGLPMFVKPVNQGSS